MSSYRKTLPRFAARPLVAVFACFVFFAVLAVTAAAPANAAEVSAAENDSGAGAIHGDVEIDPFAYALGGYSIHAGVGHDRLRFSLGAFALELPSLLEPDESFETAYNGFGVKLQYFLFAEQEGLFVGLDSNVAYRLVESNTSNAARRQRTVSAGVAAGWRVALGDFYLTPWAGVGYDFGIDDVELDGRTYETTPVTPFATVHIGYRFR